AAPQTGSSLSENYLALLWHHRLYLYILGMFNFSLRLCFQKSGEKDAVLSGAIKQEEPEVHVSGVKIFYGSQTGTAKGFAKVLSEELKALGFPAEVIDMKDYDPDDRLADECVSGSVCVFLVATYTDGQPTESAEWFCKWLEDASTDFRYGRTYLKGLRYAVFGLGNSVYVGHYNTVCKNVDKWLWMLSAKRLMTRGEGDCNVVKSRHGSIQADFQAWKGKFLSRLQALATGEKKTCSGKNCKTGSSCKSKKEEEEASKETGSEVRRREEGVLLTVTELGKNGPQQDGEVVKFSKLNGVKKIDDDDDGERREMITAALREALTKQGYKLIGSHSGVKLCRWTKSMLRGRGGCYKHTFYGIESHRCMETTPSLACANKCVFYGLCWKHRSKLILTSSLLVTCLSGVPGVKPERYEEGLAVKHCALSLVGEPIMYPEINAFIRLLHSRRISSFLVTNAQFPEEIRSLEPVTQLYVSVDASTKDSLKKIDRPLFKDFWPRFLDSLKALGEKRQRTVYRLTLVKAWNVEEMQAYAELIALGQPDFIEVKGVTYCGESSASTLTMANVPWHQEVVAFVQQLAAMLPEYEVACEHEHSNCLLIAHKKFKLDGDWWTWIDYERFQDLVQAQQDSGGRQTFSALDYMARTPSWALFGAREQGFDPADTRFQRRNKTKDISGC
uniref:tRNA 4-demethylwyosine synthase (AdoMet-dependent) n=1 Tax=Oryzias latipes TaxID=8090 RepID=A0A3P9HHC4_ORYLA